MSDEGSLTEGQTARDVQLTTQLYLSAEVKNERSYTSTSHMPLRCGQR